MENKKSYKFIINISIILVISGIILFYVINEEGIDNIIYKIKNIDAFWFGLGIIAIVGYWLIEALILHIITIKLYHKQKFIDSLSVNMVGQLFNNITPFSSGGQPIQSVAMVKNGISVSNNAPILLIKFIVYQTALILYTGLVILFKFDYFKNDISGFVSLSIIGFIINLIIVILLFLVGIKKNFIYHIISVVYKFLGKIKLLKNVNEKLEKIDKSLDNFHYNFKAIKGRIKTIIISFILSFIQITLFCLITYFVYKSFGYNKFDFVDIISAQAFLMMIMSFMPTPGASGAAEGGFLVIFSKFFNEIDINMAVLVWRFITFYLPIFVGMIFMIKLNNKKKD